MKNIVLIITAIFLSTTMGCSQEPGSGTASEKAPKIEFVEKVHDFGEIEYGGNGTVEFVFKNTGDAPLILSNVKSSCGCTVPKWSKEPVKEGDEGIIIVKYDTKRVGSFTKSITVTSNTIPPSTVIQIKGKVKPAPTPENTAQ